MQTGYQARQYGTMMKREVKNTMRAPPTTNIAMETTNTTHIITLTKGTERLAEKASAPMPTLTPTILATADTQKSMIHRKYRIHQKYWIHRKYL